MPDAETIEICPIWRAIIQNVGYKPHPWDNAREGTLTGVDDAVRAIREHIAADLIASLRAEREVLREALGRCVTDMQAALADPDRFKDSIAAMESFGRAKASITCITAALAAGEGDAG